MTRMKTRGRLRSGAVIALATVLATAVSAGAASAASSTPPAAPPNPDVPYAATVAYRLSAIDIVEAKFTVLTVARMNGATVLYYALTDAKPGADAWVNAFPERLGTPYRAGQAHEIGLIDAAGKKFYMPLSTGGSCLCGTPGDLQAPRGTADPVVGYAVMPELPASLTRVSVQVGGNVIIPDVPISASLPKGETVKAPVPIGSWPILPRQEEIAAADPSLVTLDLTENVADKQAATSTSSTSTSVALDSDVLFDFGRSDLTAQASATLNAVAADIDKNAAGPVTITGYTDSVGTEAENLVLSQQRAQAVLAALQPRVKNAAVTFSTDGRGEQDPVADNSTDQGRALNRRVTVSYATKEQK